MRKRFLAILCACSIMANPSLATWTLLGHANTQNANTPITTTAIDTTGADLITVSIEAYNAGTLGPLTDATAGCASPCNTWIPRTKYFAANSTIVIYYCQNPTTGTAHTFTQGNTANFPSINVTAWSGSASNPYDQENGAHGITSTIQPGSITPTVDGELIIIAGAGFNRASSIDSGYVVDDFNDLAFGIASYIGHYVQPTAGAINPTVTLNGVDNDAVCATASFKPAAGGSPPASCKPPFCGIIGE